MEIEILPKTQWLLAYNVMKELRPHLSEEAFSQITQEAFRADGYTLVVAKQETQIVGVMGYRMLSDFVHGKHLYVDDLVVTEPWRSRGVGKKLLAWLESEAKSLGIKNLRLCTGIENDSGKKFYEREGWSLRAIVYKKKL